MFDENGTAVNLVTLNNAAMVATATNGNQSLSTTPVSSNQFAQLNQLLSTKDSRWLQLEVCREFQRGQCSRTDEECKFAHPPPHVDIQNGRVTACYDSIKGRCTRDNPKCKYLHPPQHLKDQLLVNGKQNLALKNLLCAQLTTPSTAVFQPSGFAPLPQLIQQSQPLVPSPLPLQYFSQLPAASLYPTLLGGATAGPMQSAGLSQTQSLAALQQMMLLQQQQQQQATTAALQSTNAGSIIQQPNSALLMALALQQQQQALATSLNAANPSIASQQLNIAGVEGGTQQILKSTTRKRNAQAAGIGSDDLCVGQSGKQSSFALEASHEQKCSRGEKSSGGGGTVITQSTNLQSPGSLQSASAQLVNNSLAGGLALPPAAVGLLAQLQQQQQLLQAAAATAAATSSSTSPSAIITGHQSNGKRSAVDKNGSALLAAANGAQISAMYAPLAPYLLQQVPAGYLPYTGQQIPPRY